MSILPRRRRSLAQTTTEYMLMISVASLALWAILVTFSDPAGPIQTQALELSQDYQDTLDNSKNMKMK